jgi:tripartite-type tricarboxylate transporter receptor subunit TctC
MTNLTRRQALATLSAPGLLFARTAFAQDFPSQTLRIVVPYAPGGGADIAARKVAVGMGELLKQTVLVDNRPGGYSAVATGYVTSQPADGYTMLMVDPSQFAINPHIYKKLPYDPAAFEPVALVHRFPFILAVNPSTAAKTLKEFVAASRSRPAGINYGSAGSGTPLHLGMELAGSVMAIKSVHAPYKGVAPALNDLMGGQVDAVFADLPAALSYVQAGKLRALAISSRERHPLLPAVPTFAESGFPQVNVEAWLGLVVKRGTPAAVIQKLEAAVNGAVSDPRVNAWQRSIAAIPPTQPNRSQDFARLMERDSQMWGKVARDLNIGLEM